MKKTLTITLIVLSVVVLLLLAWFWLFPGSSSPVADKIRDGLPFGSGDDVNIPTADNQQPTTDDTTDPTGAPTIRLFQITRDPVAGAIAFNPSTSSGQALRQGSGQASTTIRYVDRATGHIYDVNPVTLEKTKVTNRTLPKIYEAYFRDDGNAVLFRSLTDDGDTVKSFTLTLTPPRTISTTSPENNLHSIETVDLRGDMDSIVVGSGNNLFYTLTSTGSIVSSTFSGENLKTIYSSAFTSWRLSLSGNNLFVYPKASASMTGYTYTLRTTGGNLSRVLGPLNGLVVTPNRVGGFAYSYINNGVMNFTVRETLNSEELVLPGTLAEKCVWSEAREWVLYCAMPIGKIEAGEPDNWYRGITHFSDRIWYFNTRVNISEVLADPDKVVGVSLDIYKPSLSPNEDYLIFINKNDLSLWALKLD